jgi:hypothetical protein
VEEFQVSQVLVLSYRNIVEQEEVVESRNLHKTYLDGRALLAVEGREERQLGK